ncbi:MAG: alpha-L-arabinofuranosidase C-terminal domain-containing protein [Verrucomicrobiota bacterium]
MFFGEYAAQSDKIVSVHNRNNLETAISEAAFMTGLERNAEVVTMASYAPLFAHMDGWQWTPNLIWVDNLNSYGTPNYYVQKLFANNRGDVILPVKLDGTDKKKLYASATRDNATGEIIVKIVNGEPKAEEVKLTLDGLKQKVTSTHALVLTSANLKDENSFTEPKKVSPAESTLKLTGKGDSYKAPANSLTVLRVK